MSVFEELKTKKTSLCVVGLGYVGMPLAVAFAEKIKVIGFDTNSRKIATYKKGTDPTMEVGDDVISRTSVEFTDNPEKIRDAHFIIVAVPTPVNLDKTPDLLPVRDASKIIGQNLSKGSIVVYESTVYPGVTEDVCVSILEKYSGLVCGNDFKVGYSPERINPGDSVHRLKNICKIVSGMDEETLDEVKNVYDMIIEAGTFPVSSICTAEAVKVTENSQRDINIAFINEMAMVFDRMGIDTNEVIDGMNTKWNALKFRPGLVGGHCIGVDPYYIAYEAERLGYHSQIVMAGRRINDDMGQFIGKRIVQLLSLTDKKVREARVAIMGVTFKEDCPDIRNTKVTDISNTLKEFGIQPVFTDPLADPEDTRRTYGIELKPLDQIHDMDCLIIAVAHRQYREITLDELNKMFMPDLPMKERVLIDVKAIYPVSELKAGGFCYWRL